MKKLLLLLSVLLAGVSGVWAGTPTTDAYPVPGKTYYLYAIQTDGSRSYLYNDEGTLKVSNGSKENTNAYKWTVTKSGDYYYIANVAGNKLCTSNASGYWGLSLNNNGQTFDLSSTVSDGACVSMKSSGYWWVAPKASGSWPASNYYISSHGTNADYSPNYIFEEVLTSHSLTNGAYYRIYCDNDSKQYFYDNGTALAVGSTSINANYAWKCIVNGDYYNLQNMETEKYMGWKNVQNAAYNLIIGTGDPASRGYQAKSIGMATIYGPNANATNDGRFLVMGYDNSFSQSTITYEKGSTNYSADFRFVRVKKVTFSSAVAVNGGDAVSTIYVATDGSESITLPANYKYTIAGVEKNGLQAATTIAAAGTSDISVTVSSAILVNNQKYRIVQSWQSNRFYYYANTSDASSGSRLWKKKNPSSTTVLTDGNYIWQAKSSSSNWQLYNPTAGRYIAKATGTSNDGSGVNALSATTVDDAETLTLLSAESCDYPPSDYATTCYVALKSNTKITYLNTYNSGNNYVGWHNAVHAGYYFKFIPVKTVIFSSAIAVNGGSAVSTIYVTKDGSDSFTLPTGYTYTFGGKTYHAAAAAAAIAAAGTDDISVTVAESKVTSLGELNNNTCYYINNVDLTYNRGNFCVDNDGTYVSSTENAATSTSRNTDEKKRFAILKKNENYYLWSVSENKFVSKPASLSGGAKATTLTNNPDNAMTLTYHSETITYEGNDYAGHWVFNWPETDWYLNMSGYQLKAWQNGADADAGKLFDIVEAEDFDPTDALDRFNENSVTFILEFNGNEIGRTTQTVNRGPAVIPASLDNGFMSYTYDPETIVEGTTEVTITATWNGPFQYAATYNASTAKWYTVGIHTAHESDNYIWKYDSSNDKIATESVATSAYGSITNNHLFCFVGDPYGGFSIYNKATGDAKTLYKSTTNSEQAEMATTGSLFMPSVPTEGGKTVAGGYACFQLKDQETRLNCYDNDGYKVKGWGDSGKGSTCWFLPEGRYYLTSLNSLLLTPPAGSVGTKAGITTEDVRSQLIDMKTNLESNIFYLDTNKTAVEKATFKTTLNAINNSETIALGEGYYRIVNADPRFVTSQSKRPAIYYNGTDNLQWSINGLTADYQVNSLFKLEGSGTTYTMKSPNAEKYIQTSAASGQSEPTGKLGASGASVTFTSLGSAQYNLKVASDAQSLHANGHSNGAGPGSNLVQYNGGLDSPSAWYIVKVDGLNINLSAVGDYTYSTLSLPFGVTLPADVKAYILTVENGWAVPTEISEVPAGTGVLLRGTSSSVTSATLTIKAAASAGKDISGNKLVHTYVDITGERSAGEYILGNGEDGLGFYQRKSTKKIGANKAYLQLGADIAGVKGLVLNFDDETGVNEVKSEGVNSEKSIFNLAGQRMSRVQKGVNIVNGKKVLVK